ncbi:8-amino-7-oxononanoate synthase [Glycomyces albus]
MIAAAASAVEEYGLGASGSRLVRGTTDLHEAFEAGFARHVGAETATLYSSGYLANLGAVAALAGPVLLDAHAHASLHDAARLAGTASRTFAHNDLDDLEHKLTELRPAIVVVEAVYSVLGDAAPLPQIHALTARHEALLVVDEAHAIGTIGPHGGGAADAGLAADPGVVITATLSKALGAAGGVIAGPAELRRHLTDTSRPFIYDTAPPPAVIAGAAAALDIARRSGSARTELARRAGLAAAALDAPAPAAGILSPPAGEARAATAWAARCAEHGVAVGCFRPLPHPTTAPGCGSPSTPVCPKPTSTRP